jgi:hypothetical protein
VAPQTVKNLRLSVDLLRRAAALVPRVAAADPLGRGTLSDVLRLAIVRGLSQLEAELQATVPPKRKRGGRKS